MGGMGHVKNKTLLPTSKEEAYNIHASFEFGLSAFCGV